LLLFAFDPEIVVAMPLLSAIVSAAVSWHELSANGSWPAPRHSHSAVVSRERDWMLLFGGNMFDPVNQLFRYDIAKSEWAQLKLPGAPSKREGHSATMTRSGQMVVFGGYNGKFLNDVHVLTLWPPTGNATNATDDGLAWRQVETSGAPPAGRDGHTAVLSPDGRTILVFGGFDGKAQRSDTFALETVAWRWRELSTSPAVGGTGEAQPPARCMHCAVWVGGEDLLPGGLAAGVRTGGGDTGGEGGVEGSIQGGLVLHGREPPVSTGEKPADTSRSAAGGGMLVYGGYSIDETDADVTHADLWLLRLAPQMGGDGFRRAGEGKDGFRHDGLRHDGLRHGGVGSDGSRDAGFGSDEMRGVGSGTDENRDARMGSEATPDAGVWERVEARGAGPAGGVFGHAAAVDARGRVWVHGGCHGRGFSEELFVLEREGEEDRGRGEEEGTSQHAGGEDAGQLGGEAGVKGPAGAGASTNGAAAQGAAGEEERGSSTAKEGAMTGDTKATGGGVRSLQRGNNDLLNGWTWRRVAVPGVGSAAPCARHKHSLVYSPPSISPGGRPPPPTGAKTGTLLLFGGVERGVARGFYALDISTALLSPPGRPLAHILLLAALRLAALGLFIAAALVRQPVYFRFGLALLLFVEQQRISSALSRLRGGEGGAVAARPAATANNPARRPTQPTSAITQAWGAPATDPAAYSTARPATAACAAPAVVSGTAASADSSNAVLQQDDAIGWVPTRGRLIGKASALVSGSGVPAPLRRLPSSVGLEATMAKMGAEGVRYPPRGRSGGGLRIAMQKQASGGAAR
jgi:hypothetical protein